MGADKSMTVSGRTGGVNGLHAGGCSCCNTPAQRRAAKKAVKLAAKRSWRNEEDAPR